MLGIRSDTLGKFGGFSGGAAGGIVIAVDWYAFLLVAEEIIEPILRPPGAHAIVHRDFLEAKV